MVVMVRGRCKEGEEQEKGPTVIWDIMDTRWVHATELLKLHSMHNR